MVTFLKCDEKVTPGTVQTRYFEEGEMVYITEIRKNSIRIRPGKFRVVHTNDSTGSRINPVDAEITLPPVPVHIIRDLPDLVHSDSVFMEYIIDLRGNIACSSFLFDLSYMKNRIPGVVYDHNILFLERKNDDLAKKLFKKHFVDYTNELEFYLRTNKVILEKLEGGGL